MGIILRRSPVTERPAACPSLWRLIKSLFQSVLTQILQQLQHPLPQPLQFLLPYPTLVLFLHHPFMPPDQPLPDPKERHPQHLKLLLRRRDHLPTGDMHLLIIPLQLPLISFRILYPSAPSPRNTYRIEEVYTERCVDAATWPPSPFLPLLSTTLHPLYIFARNSSPVKEGGTYNTPSNFPLASPRPRCFRTSSSLPHHHVRS